MLEYTIGLDSVAAIVSGVKTKIWDLQSGPFLIQHIHVSQIFWPA